MTILTSIILVAAVVAIATFIAYNVQKGTKTLKEFKADFDNNAEVQELADLAKELYNKDLRPVAPKTTIKKKKSEFPIDKPTKADKVTEQVEAMKKVVEAHDTLVEEITKISPEVVEKVEEVLPEVAPVQVETVVEVAPPTVEAVVETAKPVRKKRKYYPKKK